jgi:deoxyhypusine synthase
MSRPKENPRKTLFADAPDITPRPLKPGISLPGLLEYMGETSFEARNVWRGARLFERMIKEDDVIWLGIAGAGIAGGMGGMVISLLESGFIDVICSTGAQIYHDLHFAFELPVKAIHPHVDDDALRRHGDTRIYDIAIRDRETLDAQDALIRDFIRARYSSLGGRELSSWEFLHELGCWTRDNSPRPELSFVATAARLGVPIFWDSNTNHSIAMNFVLTEKAGFPLNFLPRRDIFDSAAIAFSSERTGFVELGGGGPKNFIQQTGPTLSQIIRKEFEGADRGIQISTAVEREGSLSSCSFREAVTWKKYRSADEDVLVQIWGEYSVIFPLLCAYVIDSCEQKPSKDLIARMPDIIHRLESGR